MPHFKRKTRSNRIRKRHAYLCTTTMFSVTVGQLFNPSESAARSVPRSHRPCSLRVAHHFGWIRHRGPASRSPSPWRRQALTAGHGRRKERAPRHHRPRARTRRLHIAWATERPWTGGEGGGGGPPRVPPVPAERGDAGDGSKGYARNNLSSKKKIKPQDKLTFSPS